MSKARADIDWETRSSYLWMKKKQEDIAERRPK